MSRWRRRRAADGRAGGHRVTASGTRCAAPRSLARSSLAGATVMVRTDAPAWLFPTRSSACRRRAGRSTSASPSTTGSSWTSTRRVGAGQAFARDFEARVEVEARLLVEHGVDVLLGDIPPLGVGGGRAGGRAERWRWATSAGTGSTPPGPTSSQPSPGSRPAYAQADVLLRLPLHSTEADAFPAFRSDRGRAAHRALRRARSARRCAPSSGCHGRRARGAAVVRRLQRAGAGLARRSANGRATCSW